jgi:hypothetical protein
MGVGDVGAECVKLKAIKYPANQANELGLTGGTNLKDSG